MGCLHSSETKSESDDNVASEPEKKVYSWDKRGHINAQDYMISDLKNETVGRLPGKVDGQQFAIQNCEDCKIYIFDHSATVTVDNSSNCQIFIGPSKGSVYIRDCSDCKFVIACQQFRTRDCKRLDVFLCCSTQPIIESSAGMKFACFQYYYPELEVFKQLITELCQNFEWQKDMNKNPEQFEAAGLSVYNNNWSVIHDFTPAADVETWTLLPENAKVDNYVPLPPVDIFPEIEVSSDQASSVVPLTLGCRRKVSDESCLVVFYPGREVKKTVKSFLREISLRPSFRIAQTKQVKMTREDARRVFGDDHDAVAIHQGSVIGLEVNGDDTVQICNEILDELLDGNKRRELVFASTSKDTSAKNIDSFYNFVDMMMS